MKTPYIAFYTADLLAHTRHLTPEQIGQAVIAVCEKAFERHTGYTPQTEPEKMFYKTLCAWEKQSTAALLQKKRAGQLGGIKTQRKNRTAAVPSAKQAALQQFADQVVQQFEPEVKTPAQKAVWFKRNCRCLADILNFCNNEGDLALRTIKICRKRLAEEGLKGGYEAVCRRIPDYYAEAKRQVSPQVKQGILQHFVTLTDKDGRKNSFWSTTIPPGAQADGTRIVPLNAQADGKGTDPPNAQADGKGSG